MDYAEARLAYLTPRDTERPLPPIADTPARRLRDAIEPIAIISFWGPRVQEKFTELGLGFLDGYVWARAAALGEPAASVVVAAFGVFEPGMITGHYEQGRRTATREQVLRAREEGSVASLAELLPDEDVSRAADLLRRATDVAAQNLTGRPLFAGLASLPWPEAPLGRLWHAACLLREYRGDVHQAASVAAGLTGTQMNVLTEYWIGWEPASYAATRGWSPEQLAAADAALAERGLVADGALTEAGRRLRDAIEEQTDDAVAPLLHAIGPELPELTTQLAGWSDRILAAELAPSDPYKRLSG